MAISYRVSEGVLFTKVEGAVTLDDVRAYLVAVRADPEYRAGMASLVDCRDVTTLLSSAELRLIAGEVKRLTTSLTAGRAAFVAPSAAGFGLLRMYEVYSEGGDVEVRAFRDYDQALEWIQERLRVREGLRMAGRIDQGLDPGRHGKGGRGGGHEPA